MMPNEVLIVDLIPDLNRKVRRLSIRPAMRKAASPAIRPVTAKRLQSSNCQTAVEWLPSLTARA
jgi:hypothetical protein